MNEFIVVIEDKLFCELRYIPEIAENAKQAAKQAYYRTDYTCNGIKADILAVYKKTSFKMPVYGFKSE